MSTILQNGNKLIIEYFKGKIPAEILFYAGAANNDLYNGPRPIYDDDEYPWQGFVHAIGKIKEWNDENLPSELFVDIDCGQCYEEEPIKIEFEDQGYPPNLSEDIYIFDQKEIKTAIYGKELAAHL